MLEKFKKTNEDEIIKILIELGYSGANISCKDHKGNKLESKQTSYNINLGPII